MTGRVLGCQDRLDQGIGDLFAQALTTDA